MRGQILSYSPESGSGLISGSDGKRYSFKGTEYHGNVLTIRPGMEVDFETHEDGAATEVFPVAPAAAAYVSSAVASGAPGSKSKVAAGLLAIFLGWAGIHKFYLGYSTAGVIMVLVSVLSCCVLSPVMSIIGLIEGIIYLTKTDAEFEETYVRRQQPWF
jgi:TM2 domain-containing membrane protein YozV